MAVTYYPPRIRGSSTQTGGTTLDTFSYTNNVFKIVRSGTTLLSFTVPTSFVNPITNVLFFENNTFSFSVGDITQSSFIAIRYTKPLGTNGVKVLTSTKPTTLAQVLALTGWA